MQNIDALLTRLEEDCDITEAWYEVADLVTGHLRSPENRSAAQIDYFTNAIGSLLLCTHENREPTAAELRICLHDLRKALSVDGEGVLLGISDKQSSTLITYDLLLETAEQCVHHLHKLRSSQTSSAA